MVASYPIESAYFFVQSENPYTSCFARSLTRTRTRIVEPNQPDTSASLPLIAVQFIPNCSSPSHRTPALALAARRRGSRGATQSNPTQPNPNKVWGIVVYYYWLYVEKERVAVFGSDRSTWLKVEFVNEKISPDKDCCCWETTADNVFWRCRYPHRRG